MASNVILGKDIVLGYTSSSTFVAFGAAKTCSVSIDMEKQEVASPSTGTWKEYILKRSSWSASISGLMVQGDTDLFDLMAARTSLLVSFVGQNSAAIEYQGYAYITSLEMTGGIKELAEYKCTLQGTGELSNAS